LACVFYKTNVWRQRFSRLRELLPVTQRKKAGRVFAHCKEGMDSLFFMRMKGMVDISLSEVSAIIVVFKPKKGNF
jgi:hypothetical protein